jgi:hypothetical protein
MYMGIPVDETLWRQFLYYRKEILKEIIGQHPVYDEEGVFKSDRFAGLLQNLGLIHLWPRTPGGQLSTANDTFECFNRIPEVESLRQIRAITNQLREPDFTVRQTRNYYSLRPFASETSRNATTGCLFQAPVALRGLIQPQPGTGLIYADFEQQEFYVAAVLAGDPEMLRLYTTDDPYAHFGIAAGIMPPGATKKSHPREREMAKTVSLAVLYGQGVHSMARKLGVSINHAEDLLAAHWRQFPRVWQWSDEQVHAGYGRRRLATRWGWYLTVGSQTKIQTLRKLPVQGTGADIMRLAHILLYEAGFRVCVPIHDAALVETQDCELAEAAEAVSHIMTTASQLVLGADTNLRVETRTLRYPERLIVSRGEAMWNRIAGAVQRLSLKGATTSAPSVRPSCP